MIYVVDDDPVNLELLGDILHREGYAFRTFVNPFAAWDAIRGSPPQLLLLDVAMPALDGIALCRRVKEFFSHTFIPVILVTAFGDREHRLEGLGAGADDFLAKPVDVVELKIKVRNFLHAKYLYDRLQATLQELQAQVALAGELQRNLFVPAPRSLQHLDYELFYFPAHHLSGDVVDVQELDEGETLFFLADVCGHGVASSLLACTTKILLGEAVRLSHRPEKILCQVNERMAHLLGADPTGYYVTAACAVVTPQKVLFSLAGHPPVLVAQEGQLQEWGEAGLPLGIGAGENYPLVELELRGTDWLLMYTDGFADLVDLQALPSGRGDLLGWSLQVREHLSRLWQNNLLGDDATALLIRPRTGSF